MAGNQMFPWLKSGTQEACCYRVKMCTLSITNCTEAENLSLGSREVDGSCQWLELVTYIRMGALRLAMPSKPDLQPGGILLGLTQGGTGLLATLK